MAETATGAVTKATTAKKATGKAAATVKRSAKKVTGTERATKAARAEALHHEVEVNKRGLSVKSLTRTLNERWDNGWRLAHLLEQRGNTVLVFEKRS